MMLVSAQCHKRRRDTGIDFDLYLSLVLPCSVSQCPTNLTSGIEFDKWKKNNFSCDSCDARGASVILWTMHVYQSYQNYVF